MYVSIRRDHARPQDVPDILRRIREGWIPVVRNVPGLIDYHVVEASGGVLASGGLFADRAGAQAAKRLAAEWVSGNLARFLLGPPEHTDGEAVLRASQGTERIVEEAFPMAGEFE
jgi:hypothetical protein